jgi:hypothetical protein
MRLVPISVLLFVLSTASALAQQTAPAPLPPEPKPPFVFDVRAGWPGITRDRTVAAELGVPAEEMPGRGLGIVLGAHVLFPRKTAVSLGIGGELLLMRASNTVEPTTPSGPEGPTIHNRWTHMSPQVSLNFGSGGGFSYLTGGLGWSKLTMELEDDPQAPGDRIRTLNYGGGARWFAKKHLAFTFDLRFYSIGVQEPLPGRVGTSSVRVIVFTGGIALK